MAEPELPVLPPPPGGLARLRARIAADDRRRARLRWLAAPPLAALAAALLWLAIPGARSPVPLAASHTLRDPSVGDDFYWIAPGEPPPRRPAPAVVDMSAVTIQP